MDTIMHLLRSACVALLLLTGQFAVAQGLPLVDITLVDNGNNELEVRIRPDADFDGYFASTVFTIRWNASDNANLGVVQQVPPVSQYFNTAQSGPETDDNGYRYQIFAGFGGAQNLSMLGLPWTAGAEYTLLVIPVLNGTSFFEIVNDTWTDANNGGYYVSLNGQDRTGIIYGISTGVEMGPATEGLLQAVPNPTSGEVSITIEQKVPGSVRLELINASGQVVWNKALSNVSGVQRHAVDFSGMAKGAYTLRSVSEEAVRTQRMVLQ